MTRTAIFVVVLGVGLLMPCPAETGAAHKPACNSRHQSQLWPDEANHSPGVARRLYQHGELEMCSLVVWKYRWQNVSVNIRDAKRMQEHRTAPPPPPLQTATEDRK